MDFSSSQIEQARTEHEMLLEDPRNARKKRRQDRRRRRKYKFSDKHHAKGGIAASVLAVISLALIIASICLATAAGGEGGQIVGIMPFLALLMSTAGIVLASLTFRKPDTIYTFSWIGLTANIVLWLFVAVVLVMGL